MAIFALVGACHHQGEEMYLSTGRHASLKLGRNPLPDGPTGKAEQTGHLNAHSVRVTQFQSGSPSAQCLSQALRDVCDVEMGRELRLRSTLLGMEQ